MANENLGVIQNDLKPEAAPMPQSILGELFSLNENSKKLWDYGQEMQKKLPDIIEQADQSIANFLNIDPKVVHGLTGNIQKNIGEQFNSLVTDPAKKFLSDSFWEKAGMSFNGKLFEGLGKILNGIASFEKTIDKLMPGLSESILDILGSSLKGIVGSIIPLNPLAKTLGSLIDTCMDYLKPNNLEKNIQYFQEKVEELKSGKLLEQNKELGELSKASSISISSLNRMGMDKEYVKKLTASASNPENKNFLKECADIIPKDAADIDNKIKKIASNVNNFLEKANLKNEEAKKITDAFSKTKEILKGTLDETKTLPEKLNIIKSGMGSILALPAQIDFKESNIVHSGLDGLKKELKSAIGKANLDLGNLRKFENLPIVKDLKLDSIIKKEGKSLG